MVYTFLSINILLVFDYELFVTDYQKNEELNPHKRLTIFILTFKGQMNLLCNKTGIIRI